MSDEPLTCPYCNARQPAVPGLAVGQKIACARCGEVFPVRQLPAGGAVPAGPPAASAEPLARPVRSNRLVAGVVLGVMVLTAGAGLTYALLTVDARRGHDKALPRQSRRPWLDSGVPTDPGEPTAPGQLEALGYLPESTGLLLGVQVQDLLLSPAGKQMEAGPLRIGNVEVPLAAVKDWTGVAVEDVDHLVVGVAVRDSDKTADLTPPVHIVVRTRKAYEPARVRVALKATGAHEERTPEGGKRTVYKASLRGLPAYLWLADERTLVLGLLTTSLELVPGKSHEGLARLPAELREVIETRLRGGTPVWAAGHSADWGKTWLPTLLGGVKEVPLARRLAQVRSFALWLVPTEPPKLGGAFRCASAEVARDIEEKELAPRQKEQPETFKFSRAGEWIDVQLTLPGG